METLESCPECGAEWRDGQTCQDHFHQMLFWESEYPAYGEVHHLMVLCYHLQHPGLYSPEGLNGAISLLADFLDRGLTPAEVRERDRDKVSSGKRTWKITGSASSRGSYDHPIRWTITAGDVIAGGVDRYTVSVREWAKSVHAAITKDPAEPKGFVPKKRGKK